VLAGRLGGNATALSRPAFSHLWYSRRLPDMAAAVAE